MGHFAHDQLLEALPLLYPHDTSYQCYAQWYWVDNKGQEQPFKWYLNIALEQAFVTNSNQPVALDVNKSLGNYNAVIAAGTCSITNKQYMALQIHASGVKRGLVRHLGTIVPAVPLNNTKYMVIIGLSSNVDKAVPMISNVLQKAQDKLNKKKNKEKEVNLLEFD